MIHKPQRLSEKQFRFVEEYLVDLNATQAAIRAGYSASAAKVTASRLLTDANVASAISDLRSKLSRKLELTAENVLSELAKIGFANMADFYQRDERGNLVVDVDTLTDPVKAAAVVQMDLQTSADGTQMIKLKLGDKKSALIELGKHLGVDFRRELTRDWAVFPLRSDPCLNPPLLADCRGHWSDRHGVTERYPALASAG